MEPPSFPNPLLDEKKKEKENTPKRKKKKSNEEDEFIPDFDVDDEDHEMVLLENRLKYYSIMDRKKGKRGKKGKKSKKRKKPNIFNPLTFRGQLLIILRDSGKWMVEREIRESLMKYYEEGKLQKFGFSLQISTQMGQLWRDRVVNRKGFLGSFEYKLVTEHDVTKKRKLDDAGGQFSVPNINVLSSPSKPPPKEKKIPKEINKSEVIDYILRISQKEKKSRKYEFMNIIEIKRQYEKITKCTISFPTLEKLLLEKNNIERGKGKRKNEYQRIDVNVEKVKYSPPPPPPPPKRRPPPPQVLVAPPPEETVESVMKLLPFKCPILTAEKQSTSILSVSEYIKAMFRLNPNYCIDMNHVRRLMNYLQRKGKVVYSNLRQEMSKAVDNLTKTSSVMRHGLADSNIFIYIDHNLLRKRPDPKKLETFNNISLNRHLFDRVERVRLIRNISHGSSSSSQFLHRRSEKRQEEMIECRFDLEGERETSQIKYVGLAISELPKDENAIHQLRYYNRLRTISYDEKPFLKVQDFGTNLRKLVFENPDELRDALFVIFSVLSNRMCHYNDMVKKDPRPIKMLEVMIGYLSTVLRCRRDGLLIIPRLELCFIEDFDTKIAVKTLVPLITTANPQPYRYVDKGSEDFSDGALQGLMFRMNEISGSYLTGLMRRREKKKKKSSLGGPMMMIGTGQDEEKKVQWIKGFKKSIERLVDIGVVRFINYLESRKRDLMK